MFRYMDDTCNEVMLALYKGKLDTLMKEFNDARDRYDKLAKVEKASAKARLLALYPTAKYVGVEDTTMKFDIPDGYMSIEYVSAETEKVWEEYMAKHEEFNTLAELLGDTKLMNTLLHDEEIYQAMKKVMGIMQAWKKG